MEMKKRKNFFIKWKFFTQLKNLKVKNMKKTIKKFIIFTFYKIFCDK